MILPTLQDGTIEAVVDGPGRPLDAQMLLPLLLPPGLGSEATAGRPLLARCGAQTPTERASHWQIYGRRALFPARWQPLFDDNGGIFAERWQLVLPAGDDPGHVWLRSLVPGTTVNLIGPVGRGFALAPTCRNLLLLADAALALRLLPLVDTVLDRGGRVTLVVRQKGASRLPLLAELPVMVEVHGVEDEQRWREALEETLPWADAVCASLAAPDGASLAAAVRRRRFRLDAGFFQLLMPADLFCGAGACLACVIPLADGRLTRACINGPVMDLSEIAGR